MKFWLKYNANKTSMKLILLAAIPIPSKGNQCWINLLIMELKKLNFLNSLLNCNEYMLYFYQFFDLYTCHIQIFTSILT